MTACRQRLKSLRILEESEGSGVAMGDDWPAGLYERTAGAWQGEFCRELQGEYEKRLEMEGCRGIQASSRIAVRGLGSRLRLIDNRCIPHDGGFMIEAPEVVRRKGRWHPLVGRNQLSDLLAALCELKGLERRLDGICEPEVLAQM